MPEERVDVPRSKPTAGKYYDIAATLFSTGRSGELVDLFIAAARDGDYNRIESLLQRRGDAVVSVDAKDKRTGNTPLIWAAKRGHIKIVELLLKHGADVTLRNYNGQTAVEVASPGLKALLLDAVDSSSLSLHQRLLQAAWQGNAAAVSQLLRESRSLDIDCQNADGLSPLMLLCRDMQLFERLSLQLKLDYDPVGVLSVLLQYRANVHAVDGDGKTCLHHVSQSKSAAAKLLVGQLLQHGSQTDLRDRQCCTPIHCASQSGNVDVINCLIDGGSEVNVRGFAGNTPLHYSAYNDHERAAATLLDHGADILLTDDRGLTALDVARSKKMKSKLREAWTEVTESRAEIQLAPVRDGSRLSMRGDTGPAQSSQQKNRGEVLFDGLPLNPFSNRSSQSKPGSKPLTPAEKAVVAEQLMVAGRDSTQISSPIPGPRDGGRRFGIRRQPTSNRPNPLPVTSKSSEKLPPVRGEFADSMVTKSKYKSGPLRYQRSLTDLSRMTKNNKQLAKLFTYPRSDAHRAALNLSRDSPISVVRIATELDEDFRVRKLSGTPGRDTPIRHSPGHQTPKLGTPHRRSNSDSSPNSALLLPNNSLQFGRRRCLSTPSCGGSEDFDTEEEELRLSPGLSPRQSTSINKGLTTVNKTLTATHPPSGRRDCLPSLAQMRLTRSCTPIHGEAIFPNSRTVLPPTPVQRSLSSMDKLTPATSDAKETSPRSSDEFGNAIRLTTGGEVIEVERRRPLLKTEFIIEESRPKDLVVPSSGSDSCDSVESNPAKAVHVNLTDPPASKNTKPNNTNSASSSGPLNGKLITTDVKMCGNVTESQLNTQGAVSANKLCGMEKVNSGVSDSPGAIGAAGLDVKKSNRPLSNTDKLRTVAKENAQLCKGSVSGYNSSSNGTKVSGGNNTSDSSKVTGAKTSAPKPPQSSEFSPVRVPARINSGQSTSIKVTQSQKQNSASRKPMAVQPTRLISSVKKRAILQTKQVTRSEKTASPVKSVSRSGESETLVKLGSPTKQSSSNSGAKASQLETNAPKVHVLTQSETETSLGASTSTKQDSQASVLQSSPSKVVSSRPQPHSSDEPVSTPVASTKPVNEVGVEVRTSSEQSEPVSPTKLADEASVEVRRSSEQLGPDSSTKLANGASVEVRRSPDQLGKTPLVKILPGPSEPRVSQMCLEAPTIQQTPLIVNPFEDFFCAVSGALFDDNVPDNLNRRSPAKNARVGSASSRKPQNKPTKVSKPAAQKGKQTNSVGSPKKRVSSGRRRGAKSEQKSGAGDEKLPSANARPKTAGKSGKRVRSGKGRGKKADKENLGKEAAKPDVALISGIGWHITTSCDDKSDVHAVKITLDSDSSSEEDCEKLMSTPRLTGLRPFSSPSPRFVEVKTPTALSDAHSMLSTENLPPMNLDMSRNTIHRYALSRSWNLAHTDIEVNITPATHVPDDITLESASQLNLALQQELLMSKLSPIPESPALFSTATTAREDFSKNRPNDMLSNLLASQVAECALLNDQIKVSARDNVESDSDSNDTLVSEGSQPYSLNDQSKERDNVFPKLPKISSTPENRFVEVKRAEYGDEDVDDIVEEILSSTGPASLNSTLRSNKSASSKNSTLTEGDVKILKTLQNSDSPFHAKTQPPEVSAVRRSEEVDEQLGTNPDLLKVFHAENYKIGQRMKAMIDAGADQGRVKAMIDAGNDHGQSDPRIEAGGERLKVQEMTEVKQLERIIHSFRKMELHASANHDSGEINGPRESHSPRRSHASTLEHKSRSQRPPNGRPHSSAGFTSASKVRRGRFTEIKDDKQVTKPESGGGGEAERFVGTIEDPVPDLSDSPAKLSRTDSHDSVNRSNSACSSSSAHSISKLDEETICWKKGNILGKGAFGTVWCGLTGEGELIAVKQIELNTSDLEKATREYEKIQEEVELLKTLTHKNIVGYLGTSFEDNLVSIYMQFVPGGSIASVLARFGALEERVFCLYTKQILQGVEYLHNNDVIHRDIKGGNIMLMPTGVIKLIDFGCAKRLCINLSMSRSQILKSMKGTPYWMAPEVVNETGHGKKSDIWSIGCTVFEMATRKPPWSHMTPIAAIFAIGCDKPVPELPDHFSKDVRDFVSKCLTRDQTARMSATEALQHRFITRRRKSRAL